MSNSNLSSTGGHHRHDWVEELAIEIQERILERQRELQVELYRREQDERQRQFVSSLMLGQPAAAATLNHHNIAQTTNPQQQGRQRGTARNTVLSVDEMAAGWLLYRQFAFRDFGNSDSRRRQSARSNGTGSSRRDGSDNVGDPDNDDVRVADLSLPRGLEPRQISSPVDPAVSPGEARTPSLFEMVGRSARRLGEETLPPRQHTQPRPIRFLNAGRESSNRFMPRRSSNTDREAIAPTNDRRNLPDTTATTGTTTETAERRNRDRASHTIENAGANVEADDEEILNSADA